MKGREGEVVEVHHERGFYPGLVILHGIEELYGSISEVREFIPLEDGMGVCRRFPDYPIDLVDDIQIELSTMMRNQKYNLLSVSGDADKVIHLHC